jgi:hypothetical protein
MEVQAKINPQITHLLSKTEPGAVGTGQALNHGSRIRQFQLQNSENKS